MIQAALFDFDGTLVDTLENISYCAKGSLKKIGIEDHTTKEEFKYLVGNGADLLVHRLLALHGRDNEQDFSVVCQEFRRLYNENPVYLAEIYDGILSLLNQLKGQGTKLGIVTNKPHSTALLCTERLFGTQLFDGCCGQREGLPLKPDPTGARELLKELGISPEQTVYLGDTGVDMQTGKSLGAFTVGVLWGFRKREELEQNGADAIITHPSELLSLL